MQILGQDTKIDKDDFLSHPFQLHLTTRPYILADTERIVT